MSHEEVIPKHCNRCVFTLHMSERPLYTWLQKTHTIIATDGVQPKMSQFSKRHLFWVNYKVVSQLSQPIFLSFSYLNSPRHNLVIELCCSLKIFYFFMVIHSTDLQSCIYLIIGFPHKWKFSFSLLKRDLGIYAFNKILT